MKILNLSLTLALLININACTTTTEKTECPRLGAYSTILAKHQELTGTFEGILPAADCEGIRTTLTLNEDKTYTYVCEYIGVKDGLFTTSGIYTIINNDLVELTTLSSNEKTYYKRVQNGFMLSDSKGTINQGELAEHYVLKRR